MRLINADSLIEDFDPEHYFDWYTPSIIETINKQPTVELSVRGKWIPCSERLPETNGVYSITRKISDGEYRWYISDSAYFDGQNTWHSDNRVNHDREYLKDVIAWMPLPAPYDMRKKVEE